MKRSQIVYRQHEHSLIWWDFYVIYGFVSRELFFGIRTVFAKLCHSCILCHITRGFSAHDITHMHLWIWNSFEMIIPIQKTRILSVYWRLYIIYLKICIELSFQNSYVKQMLTVIKRGFVLTKSVNAFQDGIHRKIAKVSAKNQPYLTKAYLNTDSKRPGQHWHCDCDFGIIFRADSYFIF